MCIAKPHCNEATKPIVQNTQNKLIEWSFIKYLTVWFHRIYLGCCSYYVSIYI